MKRFFAVFACVVLASGSIAQSDQQLQNYLKRSPDADLNGDGKLTREEAREHRRQRDPTRGDNLSSKSEIPPVRIPDSIAPLKTVSLKSEDGVTLDFAYRKPVGGGPFPVIIFFHGGGGMSNLEGLKRNLMNGAVQTRFLEQGFMTVQSTRRPYWESRDNKQPTGFAGAVQDAAMIVETVKSIAGADPDRITLYGGSGGGILAVRTAAEVDVSHVVAGEPATVVALDPREGKAGGSAAYRDVMNNPQKAYTKARQKEMRAWMNKIEAPVLLLQGNQTGLYKTNFEILIPEMKKLGKDISFIEFAGLSHGFYWGTAKTGATLETVEKIVQNVTSFVRLPGKPDLYFPESDSDWETLAPGEIGWDSERLQDALDYAGRNQSSGVVILYKGRILAEQYWELDKERSSKFLQRIIGRDAANRNIEDVASAQKSVAAVLVGIAQEKGLLNIDDRVEKYLGPGWSRAEQGQEKAITVRHLITMTTGLDGRGQFEAIPGSKWKYNTAAYSMTMKVVEKASGMDRNELTKKWLTGPLGMAHSKWVRRGSGDYQQFNAYGFATTARDLARFGLMMLADGNWDGGAILADKAFLKDATTSSQSLNPYYGYLWWLNRNSISPDEPARVDSIPIDMYSANGALIRRCYVVPSMDLVVTRIGDQPDAGRAFDKEFWSFLMKAAPQLLTE